MGVSGLHGRASLGLINKHKNKSLWLPLTASTSIQCWSLLPQDSWFLWEASPQCSCCLWNTETKAEERLPWGWKEGASTNLQHRDIGCPIGPVFAAVDFHVFQPLNVRLGIAVDLAVKLHIAPNHHSLVGREPCLQDRSVGWPFWNTEEKEILIYPSFFQQGLPSAPFSALLDGKGQQCSVVSAHSDLAGAVSDGGISLLFSKKGANWDCHPFQVSQPPWQPTLLKPKEGEPPESRGSQPHSCHSFSGSSLDQLGNLLIADPRLKCWSKGGFLLASEDAWFSHLGKKPSSCFLYPVMRLFNITTDQLLRENREISPNTSSWYVCLILPYLFSTTQV